MSGWSGAAISRRSRSLCASQNRRNQISGRSKRRCQSSKRPEQPTSSPTITAQRSYTTSWDLTPAPPNMPWEHRRLHRMGLHATHEVENQHDEQNDDQNPDDAVAGSCDCKGHIVSLSLTGGLYPGVCISSLRQRTTCSRELSWPSAAV